MPSSSSDSNKSLVRNIALAVGAVGAIAGAFFLYRKFSSSEATTQQQQQHQPKATAELPLPTTTVTPVRAVDEAATLEKIAAVRAQGNSFFSAGRKDHALECYQQVVDLCDQIPKNAIAQQQKCVAISNSITVFNSSQRYQHAEFAATGLIDTALFDSAELQTRVNAYIRRAAARVGLKQFEAAKQDIALSRQECDKGLDETARTNLAKNIASLEQQIVAAETKK
jgi:hypothetical protein